MTTTPPNVGQKRTISINRFYNLTVTVTMSASRVVLMKNTKPHYFHLKQRLEGDKCWTDETIRKPHPHPLLPNFVNKLRAALAARPIQMHLTLEGRVGSGMLTMLTEAAELAGTSLFRHSFPQTIPGGHKRFVWNVARDGFVLKTESVAVQGLEQALQEPTKMHLIVLDRFDHASSDARTVWLQAIRQRSLTLENGETLLIGDNVRFVLTGQVGLRNVLFDVPERDRWLCFQVPTVTVDSSSENVREFLWSMDRWAGEVPSDYPRFVVLKA